ncbi:mechanosensitive ion channel domain-containing protein, partial [Planctomycetota bacterium]
TLAEIESRIKQLTADREKQQDEEQIKQLDVLIGKYQQAREQLNQLNNYQAALDGFKDARTQAPKRLDEIQDQIKEIPAEIKIDQPYQEWSLTQTEQQHAQLLIELDKAKKEAAARENDAKTRTQRRTEIPQEIAQAQEKLTEIKGQLSVKPPEQTSPELIEANRILLLLTQGAQQKRIEANNEEILSYDARGDLLTARRNLAARQAAYNEKLTQQWQVILDQKRKQQAEQAAEQARQARRIAAQAHPIIQKLANRNVELAELRTGQEGLGNRILLRDQYLKKIQTQLDELKKDFDSIKQQIDAVGLTNVFGVMLLSKRSQLPDIRSHQKAIRDRQLETANAYSEWLQYHEMHTDLVTNLEKYIDNYTADVLKSSTETTELFQDQDIENEIRNLLQNKRGLLEELIKEYDAYRVKLSELEVKEHQLLTLAIQYADYIDENVLWIKSAETINLKTLTKSRQAVFWLISPQNWGTLIQQYSRDLKAHPVNYMFVLLIFGLLTGYRRRLKSRLILIAEKVGGEHSDIITHTLNAILLSLLLALPVPLLLYFLGWHVVLTYQNSDFVIAAAAGLRSIAAVYLVLALLRVIFLPSGLAVAHFHFKETAQKFCRKNLFWFMVLILPLVFVVEVFNSQPNMDFKESLGKLVLIAALIILTVLFVILLRPAGRFMKSILREKQGGWLDRLRFFWFGLIVILPLVFALLAVLGYHYAAYQLTRCLQASLILILFIVFLAATSERFLFLTQSRMVYRKHLMRRAELEKKQTENVPALDSDIPGAAEISPEDELRKLVLQSKRFINTFAAFIVIIGFWYIWSEVFPALGVLNRVALWETNIAGELTSITLANLILALLIVLITFVIARNILGLLEVAILQRLPLDQGAQFAIVTLTRYIIVVVGVVLSFGQIGIGWSKVQWLVAALSLGLGFGLQEIFANFVSGLLILFEQPIRVGDIVTVDNVSGKVTKISIRATTVRDWDRKEYLVPNKDFITGRLLNWTLSDKVNRIVINVGIAYGSNVELALNTLLRIAREHPIILDDPEPIVTFEGFGDSSLNMVLRCFLPNLDDRLLTISQLYQAIDREFRKSGIEIAFPQRDIHIRSADLPIPLAIKTNENVADLKHDSPLT